VAERVLLILPKTSYRADAFVSAARAAGVDLLVASDRCHVLDGEYAFPENSFVVDLGEPDAAAARIVEATRAFPVRAVIPAGGETAAYVAALAAARLGLAFNPPAAAEAARNKRLMREHLGAAGVPQPRWLTCGLDDDPVVVAARVADELDWPCVLKPLLLSGSRGVMRADDGEGFVHMFERLRRLLRDPELLAMDGVAARQVLVESFVPGIEVALEGLLEGGRLTPLAIFDKPDPLDGPFFEETLYITPSRLPAATQAMIASVTQSAARAMGLVEGPVHAELRLPHDCCTGTELPVVIEVAARSIGGLCGRMLRFGTGMSLEELLIRHAIGADVSSQVRERAAAGAMMLPIPAAGVLKAVDGEEEARALPGVEDVVISTAIGAELVPLPEGSSYLGFVFARGETPEAVEAALRAAHRALRFTISPTLTTV
jgi:biotin carboxylase